MLINILIVILVAYVHSTITFPPEYECIRDLPDSLSFSEPMIKGLEPGEIMIFSGGHARSRRQSGFGRISADSLVALANFHGYKIKFLDEIDYEKRLVHMNETFGACWQKIFAAEALKTFTEIKYFVWFDDDIIAPYAETDMLNHYVNLMASNPEWLIMYGDEGGSFVLNAGFYIFHNHPRVFEIFEEVLDIGATTRLRWTFGYEQEAMATYRQTAGLESQIKVISHRDGPYNINTFMRYADHDPVEVSARRGDAFVHFLGMGPKAREARMTAHMADAENWRRSRPSFCKYPVSISRLGDKTPSNRSDIMHFSY